MEDWESCSADFGRKSCDFFFLAAKARFILKPPATAAEMPLRAVEEEVGGGGGGMGLVGLL